MSTYNLVANYYSSTIETNGFNLTGILDVILLYSIEHTYYPSIVIIPCDGYTSIDEFALTSLLGK